MKKTLTLHPEDYYALLTSWVYGECLRYWFESETSAQRGQDKPFEQFLSRCLDTVNTCLRSGSIACLDASKSDFECNLALDARRMFRVKESE